MTFFRMLLAVVWSAVASVACALPPMGLTVVGPAGGDYHGLNVLGDKAYLVGRESITIVNSAGSITSVNPTHPSLGTPQELTPAILANDGEVYYGARFADNIGFVAGSALYRANQPSSPIATWLDKAAISGVLPSLISLGGSEGGNHSSVSRYFLDGTIETFPVELPARDENPRIGVATPSGFMAGGASIIGTIGDEGIFWDSDGAIVDFPDSFLGSLKDRDDGSGVVADLNNLPVVYTFTGVWNQFFTSVDFNSPAVFHSDWILTGSDLVFGGSSFNRHGVSWSPLLEATSEKPLVLHPLLEVFPDLPPMVNSRLIDADTVDGRFYLLFETNGQTYLYGGIDPSVVPEPAGWLLALGLLAAAARAR